MSSAWLEFPEHGIAVYRPSENGGRYRIRYVDRDGIRRERTGGTTDREARRRVQELLERLDRGLTTTSTVGRLLDEYLRPENHRTRTGRPWSPRYTDRQARIVRLHVRPQLDARKEVSALTRHDFVRILNAASATGLATSTVADVGAVCRSIVTFAIEQRLLVDNPMLGVVCTSA